MKYGCIGEHLGHSFSKEIHKCIAEYSYELCEVARDSLQDFLAEKNFCGINVTIPYKTDVIPYLDKIDDAAREIGAVNTVVNRKGCLCGYNTDAYGLRALIEHIGVSLKDRKVAVLGSGGTSKTAVVVAKSLGAREVLVVSRTAQSGAIDYKALISEHADTEYLINTTPCGMYPHGDSIAVDPSVFPQLLGVADAVYNPLQTRLVLAARKKGIPAEGGLYMLVAQAVRASEIFLDTQYPIDLTEKTYRKILREKQNVVLVGMPGCGKSTVGRELAETMGRELIDMDAAIVARVGKSIPEIFSEDGEAVFRDLETAVLREDLRYRNGCILATGGGTILRDENVALLRQNGRLYFLDRPLKDLLPTEDRPLASSAEAIQKRYAERYDRYLAIADRQIAVEGDAASVALAIRKDFEET